MLAVGEQQLDTARRHRLQMATSRELPHVFEEVEIAWYDIGLCGTGPSEHRDVL